MDKAQIKNILTHVQSGQMSVKQALDKLKSLPFDDLGFAKIDTHRSLRKGFPEVIYCAGKTLEQITEIVKRIPGKQLLLATRAGPEVFQAVKKVRADAVYHELPRVIIAGKVKVPKLLTIAVASAGTSDIPVAEEAALTAEVLGNRVKRLYDVGVAGVHRLFAHKDILLKANVVIVVAGMDGALASIVGGLVSRPVIAVPTSVGYGAHFNGVAPLLTMLNSCAPGVAVVNIDNGFGAGYMAGLVNQNNEKEDDE
ncbi:MAG: nickel pincer cofactor biosynthesis protein LarB [Candidatus Omnitrophica bacterium]|nr:nickel pincer cofactor biosynthesis protein LarB [Candidatus Omnitrophota bacterium]